MRQIITKKLKDLPFVMGGVKKIVNKMHNTRKLSPLTEWYNWNGPKKKQKNL